MGQKFLLDLLMAGVLLALMAYPLIGELEHEILGVALAILFLIHQIKNFSWYKNSIRGKYTYRRAFLTLINLSLLILMAAQIFSGVLLSKELFVHLNLGLSVSTARLVHLSAAYWLFVLVSVHIGWHWKIIIAFAQKKLELESIPKIFKIAAAIFAAYGLYALINRQFLDYMFLKSEFVFFNFDEPVIFFLGDCAAIMAFFIFIVDFIMTR